MVYTPYSQGFVNGIKYERNRIIELLLEQNIIRRDSFGVLVFHNDGDLYAKDVIGLEAEDRINV